MLVNQFVPYIYILIVFKVESLFGCSLYLKYKHKLIIPKIVYP